jgi:hypothetical protein
VAAVDAFSNVDPTPATASWTLDSTPPDTTFTETPKANTSFDSAHFKFETAEPKATFECSLDGDPLAACTSPQNFLSLSEGSHTFSVRALDAKGNADPSPATFQWTIDRTDPPAPTFDIAPAPPIAPPNTTVIPLPRAKANPSPPPTTVPTGPFTTGVAVLPGIAAFQTLAGMDVSWKAGPGSEPVTFDVHSGGSDMISGEGTFSGEGPVHKAGTDETHALATGSPGKTYCFNGTATDLAGNYSPFGDAACTTLPLRAKSLGHTAGWTNKSGAAHYFGGYSEATHGALTFNAFRDYLVGNWFIPSLGGIVVGRVALVATRCKGCGKVKVTYRLWFAQPGDGTTKSRSIDLSSPSDMPRKVIPLWTFPPDKDGYPTQGGRHLQIKIEVTSARKPVRIEGLGVAAF